MRRSLWMWGLACVFGCQGDYSPNPPIHFNPNMDQQARFDPQEENEFFADHRAMRLPVEGTVARGELAADSHFYRGRVAAVNGEGASTEELATTFPMPVDADLVQRGQQRYNIYCTPCHGYAGDGQGIVSQRGSKWGMVPAASFHDDRLRQVSVGHLFDVITNGVRTMPAYNMQIPPRDRWAIVAYVRALQLSKHADLAQVPSDVAAKNGWKAPPAAPPPAETH